MLCCSPKIISMYKPWKARSDTYGVWHGKILAEFWLENL
jgi:hypothetical protein